MAGAQFEYDESGGTFFYFLLSVLVLVLIPSTYYLWPRDGKVEDPSKKKKRCYCSPCEIKISRAAAKEPLAKAKRTAIQFGLIMGWVILAFLAYKVAHIERDHVEYNPFELLEIDRGASIAEIKKQYRKLSLIYHPDKDTGDPVRFMKIAKAYAALTDEESRQNWEMYGNPDGPGATTFGIALPSWIVEKKNSVWVLAVYLLVFMVALPIVVGTWWYRSIRYTGEQILLETTKMYCHFFHKTQSMNLKRAIMILGASFEFEKSHNSEVIERPSDNITIPQLIKELPNMSEKNKERPLCYPYSIKVRVLLYCHFSRMHLECESLEVDQQYVLKKCPLLIQEMINCIAQLVMLAFAGRVNRMPHLETVEKCMKLSQMVVQALWDNQSPLLQLPHFDDELLRHCVGKKRNVRSIVGLVTMKEDDRRSLLRNMSEDQYHDVMNVCAKMPYIEMVVKSEVLDDEDSGTITAGSIVTVTVTLNRKNMEVLFEKDYKEPEKPPQESQLDEKPEKEETENDKNDKVKDSIIEKKHKVWEKQKRKKGKNKKNKKGSGSAKIKKAIQTIANVTLPVEPQENGSINNEPKKLHTTKESESDSSGVESDASDVSNNVKESNVKDEPKEEEEDENWKKIQSRIARKEKVLETKSKISHSVHCPYFPEDKQEWWWLYIADRKHRSLISAPCLVTGLVLQEEVQLKFSAPPKPGIYSYSVVLKSDSYLDFDQVKNIKLDIKEEKVDSTPIQWGMSDEEKDEHEASEVSDYTTEEESDQE